MKTLSEWLRTIFASLLGAIVGGTISLYGGRLNLSDSLRFESTRIKSQRFSEARQMLLEAWREVHNNCDVYKVNFDGSVRNPAYMLPFPIMAVQGVLRAYRPDLMPSVDRLGKSYKQLQRLIAGRLLPVGGQLIDVQALTWEEKRFDLIFDSTLKSVDEEIFSHTLNVKEP